MRSRLFAALPIAVVALAACEAEPDPLMPDVVGMQLDVAIAHIDNAGVDAEPEVDGGGMFGVIDESAWLVCSQVPAAGVAAPGKPLLSVDRDCGQSADEVEADPSVTPSSSPDETAVASAEPSESAEAAAPEREPYSYDGPAYEVVEVDSAAGLGVLDQIWVLTDPVDATTAAYKDDIKALIADVVYVEGTANVLVQVVSDAEIIEAESNNTIAEFMESHDAEYWEEVLLPKEAEHWIAAYTGGFDRDALELSDDEAAFAIDWWPAGAYEHEQWKPETAN